MLSIYIQALLIIVSLATYVLIARKIRQSHLKVYDATYWILFFALMIFLALVPQVGVKLSEILRVQSAVNFIYLVIIFLLLVRVFLLDVKVSKLEDNLRRFVQIEAIRENKEYQRSEKQKTDEEEQREQ